MEYTPAGFCVLREVLGYSRAELCAVLDVSDRTIRRWESPKGSTSVPPNVWAWMEDARRTQLDNEDRVVDMIHSYLDTGGTIDYVELPYYLNQESYEQTFKYHMTNPADTYTTANATMREMAARLEGEEIEVRFRYQIHPPRDSSRIHIVPRDSTAPLQQE